MIKAGLVGLGRMGAEPSKRLDGLVPNGWLPISHVEALMCTPDVQLAAISDINVERMAWVQDFYKTGACLYSDPIELIRSKPDILTIATRTKERYDLLMHCIDNSIKAIMVEKPLANSIGRTETIIKRIKEQGTILGYGSTRRAMDIYRQAKDILASGELGELISITSEFGYGKLLWTLPHAIDLFIFFSGCTTVDYVSGHCEIEEDALQKNQYDGDPVVQAATIRFTNGIIANIVPADGLNLRLGCTKGTVTIHGDGTYIEVNFVDQYSSYFTGLKKIDNDYQTSGICHIYADMVKALKGEKAFDTIVPEEIELNQKILFSIFQSSLEEGRRISVNSVDPDFFITGKFGNLYA